MNCSKIGKYFVIRALLCFIAFVAVNLTSFASSDASILSDEVISKEIVFATSLVEGKYTPVVKKFLHNHIQRYPEATEVLLGKKTLYFPIFEQILKKHGLPEDLKYLPIIESSLNPNARSYVGATGLWQFMIGTAEMHGLKVNRQVDERKNPIRATEAAVKHLKKLYDIYGDWALTLAAYNSGPGNVNKAIRRSGSRDYWQLRSFLPRETRGYVPVYVAVNYLFKNYSKYNLHPQLPELDLQVTGRIKIYDHLAFSDIATWTELPLELIRTLNPGFTRNFVPGSYQGYTLILPKRVIEVVRQRLSNLEENAQCEILSPIQGTYEKVILQASTGDKVEDIADYFNINPYNIYDWNGAHIGEVLAHDMPIALYLFQPQEEILRWEGNYPRVRFEIIPLPSRWISSVEFQSKSPVTEHLVTKPNKPLSPFRDRKRIRLDRGQNVYQVIKSIPDMSIDKLMALNDLKSPKDFRLGMHLYIE